jgi:hypothetical protein
MVLSDESRLEVWSTPLSNSVCRTWEIINTQFQWDELRLMVVGSYKARENDWSNIAFEVLAPCLGHYIAGVSEAFHLQTVDSMKDLPKEDFGRCTYTVTSSGWLKWLLKNEPLVEPNYKDRLKHYVMLDSSHEVHVISDREPSFRRVFGS